MDQVLVADPDNQLRNVLMRSLERYGFLVSGVGTASAAMSQDDSFDVALVDINLPDADGLRVCEHMRRRPEVVIIVYSNGPDEIDQILALQAGADHCVPKNTGIREIIARIEAVQRRVGLSARGNQEGAHNFSSTVSGQELKVDPVSCTATLNDRALTMTRKEFDLLALLIENVGSNVTRSMIMERVWLDESGIQTRTIDTHVNNLRRKLGLRSSIICIRGIGYRFQAS